MSCQKIAFESKQELKRWLNDKKQWKAQPSILRPYHCERCGEWHLTSQSKQEVKRKQKHYKKMSMVIN